MSNTPTVIDTRFRTALQRLQADGRIQTYTESADINLDIAGLLKKRDGDCALLFSKVTGFDIPVIGNFLCSQANCESAFGLNFQSIRQLIGRALSNPLPPEVVAQAPWEENVFTQDIDIGKMLPVLKHTSGDPGRFITAGVVIVKDPVTGVYNASYHRLQLLGGNRTAIKMDYGRHLRSAFERAQALKQDLPIAVCIGTDLSVLYTAATMGSQMPESSDELQAAGGLRGSPLPVRQGLTQDLLIPADTEIVLEGVIKHDETVHEGPFGEFIGYMSEDGPAPVFEVSALAFRDSPVYYAINGFGRETVMLRKYVLEASLLKVLGSAVPIVQDASMTAGGLHRFHAVISVRKGSSQHDGLQRNAIMAAFGALKDLDQVIVVDDDIDIHDPFDVEYALATRLEASRGLMVMPEGRGHEYVRVGRNGIRAKLGIDATVPFDQQARFRRVHFKAVTLDERHWNKEGSEKMAWLFE